MSGFSNTVSRTAQVDLSRAIARDLVRTIKLVIEYDGTRYSGFQRQKNGESIQGTLEKVLHKICQEKITLIGAGRTDAGVHALGQVCHFETSSRHSPATLLKALNGELPRDIVVHHVLETPEDFHARYSAAARSYAYFILNRPTPSALFYPFLHWIPEKLDVLAMASACRYLVGKKDFTSFQKRGSSRKNPSTRILQAECYRGTGKLNVPFDHFKNDLITVSITAESFLYQMVRTIVGTLLDIGKRKKSPREIEKIIRARNRDAAGPAAPAKGLFLVNVQYPKKIT